MSTLELTRFTSYLRATRKELFNKLTEEDWADLHELICEEFISAQALDLIKEQVYDEAYDEARREFSWEHDDDVIRAYDEGYEEGYSDARNEYQRED